MNQLNTTGHQVWHVEELVCWTTRERLRFLWYRLRMTVHQMNHAARRMAELRRRLPGQRLSYPMAKPWLAVGRRRHSVSLASLRVRRPAGTGHGLIAIGP